MITGRPCVELVVNFPCIAAMLCRDARGVGAGWHGMRNVEFFFDLSSPWTYLAFHNVRPLVREQGAQLHWRPILVGAVFNAVNPTVYALRESPESPRMRFLYKSLQDWAVMSGLTLNFPSPHHPARSVTAMRACCVLESNQEQLERFAERVFHAYFVDQQNIDDAGVIATLADAVGVDGSALVTALGEEPAKARLRDNTQQLIDRGGFGSPTLFVDGDDMYFGNDQLPLVERALAEAVE